MNVGRLHVNTTQQLTLSGTGIKSLIPSPGFSLKLAGVAIFINNASVSSPSYAFKIVKYVNGTAIDVTGNISIASADLVTNRVLTYYFDNAFPPVGSKYLPVINSALKELNPGEVFAFNVVTSSGITTLTGFITWILAE